MWREEWREEQTRTREEGGGAPAAHKGPGRLTIFSDYNEVEVVTMGHEGAM